MRSVSSIPCVCEHITAFRGTACQPQFIESQDRLARDVPEAAEVVRIFRWMGKPLYSMELDRDIARDGETETERFQRVTRDYEAMAYRRKRIEHLHERRMAKRDRGGHVGGNAFHRKYGFENVTIGARRRTGRSPRSRR